MTKADIQYQCADCGATMSKWAGQCGECRAWNTLLEVAVSNKPTRHSNHQAPAGACYLDAIDIVANSRLQTSVGEFDRVVGGGLTVGSVTLIGGDPGIGKSTLLMQMMSSLGNSGINTLYVSGEESAQQITLRGQRLGLMLDKIKLLTETNLERVLSVAVAETPQVMVIDSIQTIYTEISQSAPGSVVQVRESAARLVRYAKQTGVTVLLVGHVTKDGTLAGPRVLEHMVDTVLYFDGTTSSRYRMIRCIKNRYGAINELGIFGMTDKGLQTVQNPSAIFLSRHEDQVSGSIIMATREGSRALLVEVQALVDASHLSSPRRVSVGLEQNRLAMLLAVLHKHGGVNTYDQDIFINVVGGIRIAETAADLAIILAIVSSLRDQPLAKDLLVFGEIGLAGEVRPVQNGQERLHEAAKHGFKKAIIAQKNKPRTAIQGLQIIAVRRLVDAISELP
jgi:DNA repair protein RadA/Sms